MSFIGWTKCLLLLIVRTTRSRWTVRNQEVSMKIEVGTHHIQEGFILPVETCTSCEIKYATYLSPYGPSSDSNSIGTTVTQTKLQPQCYQRYLNIILYNLIINYRVFSISIPPPPFVKIRFLSPPHQKYDMTRYSDTIS